MEIPMAIQARFGGVAGGGVIVLCFWECRLHQGAKRIVKWFISRFHTRG